MTWGSLRDFFRGIAWKRLSAHEVDPQVSNGHEFQGVGKLRELLGSSPQSLPTTYLLFSDDDGPPERISSTAKWYDSRANQPHRAQEWRLYYPIDAGAIQARMRAGDLMVIALLDSGRLAVLLARRGTAREAQLCALFGIEQGDDERVRVQQFARQESLSFAGAAILEDLGLATPQPGSGDTTELATLIARHLVDSYGSMLPPGREVAELVQKRLSGEEALSDPDEALHRWIEAQAAVYRFWEDEIIARRLKEGFLHPDGTADVQGFRDFTMSMRQSRVSRAGSALQFHTASILQAHGLRFEEQVITENNERPDFIFPGAVEYHAAGFPFARLRMLAVKFTLKDRWRQVLNEARRIPHKHLLTMDAAVTASGLQAMSASGLTLVIPEAIRRSYGSSQQKTIYNVREFIAHVREVQRDGDAQRS